MSTLHGMRGFALGSFSCFVMPLLAVLVLVGGFFSAVYAAPEGGVVRAGSAQIVDQGSKTLIRQNSQRAIIDWRGFGIQPNEQVQFAQPSAGSATLNRVTGNQVSLILGRMDANGQVLLINPQGIIFGKGARINVGSLIASTANISNDNFLRGKLIFDQPGRPGAGISNSGSITAADGGLIALVAPHVRNDGLIQARLGRVLIGAADTFTIDLYGDGLINLALSADSLARLQDAQGQPVKSLISQQGAIDVGGGQAVLVTATAAKGMLDSLINMSGTIVADSAVQEGGRILLLARGGNVDVSGSLSARGKTGGQIDVLGDQVNLASLTKLDAGGVYGGGTLHVGGAYQGGGDVYRAQNTKIDAGATLSANALSRGNGGEVVVWSDGRTAYAGSIQALGGSEGGDGGRVEVSGKQTLDFNGGVDAGASYGRPGSLLLDPYNFIVGQAEASMINRVLRTGTSTSVAADNDIYVNYVIDGRGRYSGGGLTLSSGNNININDYIVTNNGAINLFANSGTVTLAADKVVYAGTAPITVRSWSTLTNAFYLTSGLLSLTSTQGSVNIDQGIDSSIGNLLIQAAADVNINQPIVSLNDGNTVSITTGNDIRINAQIDGRPALGSSPNGALTMTAGRNIDLNKSIIAYSIGLTASLGTINAPTMKAGTVTLQPDGIPLGEGLFSGTGPISVTAGGDLSSGIYVTTGPVSLRSTGGNVNIDTKLAEVLGNVTIRSDAGSVNVDQEIANIRSGSNIAITTGADINLNRQIDALDDLNPLSITPVPGGSVTFMAGNSVNLNRDLVTYNGPVDVTAAAGNLNIAWNGAESRTYRIQTGSAPITVTTGGNLSTGTAPPATFPWDSAWVAGMTDAQKAEFANNYIVDQIQPYIALSTTGKLNLTSSGGNVNVDAPIPDTTGEVAIMAANGIMVGHKVKSNNQPVTLVSGAGGIEINCPDDRYGITGVTGIGVSSTINPGSGSLTLRSAGNISFVNSNGVDTRGKLTIDTRGRILQGFIYKYAPSEIELIADGGIDFSRSNFAWDGIPKISATSSNGAVHLDLVSSGSGQRLINAPSPTAGDVFTGGYIGNNVNINAGRDINLSNVFQSGNLILSAGRDANLNAFGGITGLNVTAARNIYFSRGGIEPSSGMVTVDLSGGNLTATATGGNISFGSLTDYSAIRIAGGKSLTLDAHGSVTLGILEALGPLGITARTGNINLRNDIGSSLSDPTGAGVSSLMLSAGGNIDMQGAKAAGMVNINAGGILTPAKGIYSGTVNGVSITAAGGALEKLSGGEVPHPGPFSYTGTSFGDIPLDPPAPLSSNIGGGPPVSPGPYVVMPPGLPGALTALPAQPPGMVNVSGSGIPAALSAGAAETEIEVARVAGTVSIGEIIPVEDENIDKEEKNKDVLMFAGGRGIGQAADLGRR